MIDKESILSHVAVLESENKMLREQLAEAKAAIAVKDQFIQESVAQFNRVVAKMGVTLHLAEDDVAPIPTSQKSAMQTCFAELAKLLSTKRLDALKMLGDYTEKYPKNKLAPKDWLPTEYAVECIKALIKPYEEHTVQDVVSTQACLQPLIERLDGEFVEKEHFKCPEDFERLMLVLTTSEQNDQAPILASEDIEALSIHLKELFGPKGYDLPSVHDCSSKIASREQSSYGAPTGMFGRL